MIKIRELEICNTEEFREKSKQDIEKIKSILEEAARKSHEIDSIDRPLEVEIEWASNSFVIDNMHGVHGLTRNPEKIEFNISTESSEWKPFLKSQFAHEYGHTVFMAPLGLEYESNIENWRHVMLEAHGQIFAEKAYPEIEPEWRTKFTKEQISEKWPKMKELLGEKIFSESIFKSEKFHPWLGYSLSYYIGKELATEHDLKDFPELEKDDVVQAGNKLFSK